MRKELPNGWYQTFLSEVGEIITGNTPPKKEKDNYGNSYPFVKPGDLDCGGEIIRSLEMLSEKGRKKAHLLRKGAVMVTCIGNLGKVGIAGRVLATNQQINSIEFNQNVVYDEYGYFYCLTLKDWLEKEASATTVTIINKGRFSRAPFLLPPLNEQQLIAAKLDTIMPKIEAVNTRLERIPQIIKRFRQSVLTAAVTGKLTEQWREEHSDVESVEVLYQKFCERNKKPKKNRTLQVKSLKSLDNEIDLPEIPDSWLWIKLNELGELTRGKSKHRPRNAPHLFGGKYPFIQTGDVAQSNGRITNHKQTYSEEGLAQSRLWPEGTICITIAANIANSAILTYPACFPDSIVGLITAPDICINTFAEYYIRTIKERLSQFAPATAQKNINISEGWPLLCHERFKG